VGIPDESIHQHAVENLARADALIFGRKELGSGIVALRYEAKH